MGGIHTNLFMALTKVLVNLYFNYPLNLERFPSHSPFLGKAGIRLTFGFVFLADNYVLEHSGGQDYAPTVLYHRFFRLPLPWR